MRLVICGTETDVGKTVVSALVVQGLHALRRLGAAASRRQPLSPGQWRRLLRHWPAGAAFTWEVLVLIAQQPEHP